MKARSVWCAALLLAGCASNGPADVSSNEIMFEVQDRTYDEVWSVIERVAGQSLTITERNKDAGLLKANRGVVMGPWGNHVEFTIRPAHNGASEYSVELESLEQKGSRLPTEDWATHGLPHQVRTGATSVTHFIDSYRQVATPPDQGWRMV